MCRDSRCARGLKMRPIALQLMLKNLVYKISGLASNFSSCELEFLSQTAFDSKSKDYIKTLSCIFKSIPIA